MPELPEVETIANGMHERVQGRTIVGVWTSGKPQTFKSPGAEIEAVLTGSTIEAVRRVGKTVVMSVARREAQGGRKRDGEVDGEARELCRAEFLVHLGMTGRLLVSSARVPVPVHTHAVLTLDDGREVRFVDARRFGRLSVQNEAYSGPGVEPLTVASRDFAELFRGRKTAIKAALLNQALLHGVGNIYADESLFRAGIRPRTQAGRLSKARLERLRVALVEVLHHAIQLGGSSVSDYVDADGVRGFFQLEHRVYLRTGQPCRVCGTAIRRVIVGGRGTHFCPKCQQ